MPYQGVFNTRIVQLHLSSLESQFFSFFRRHTTREICGYFHSSLWNYDILQLIHYEPAILHAAVAVGAMHHVSRGNSPTLQALNSYGEQPGRQQSFALAQYVKALKRLREMLDKQRYNDNSNTVGIITLVACLLFMCLEMLQGNRVGSLQHLRTGLRVLTESNSITPQPGSEKEMTRLFVNSDQLNSTTFDSLTSVFRRLDYEATMFDKTAPLLQLRPSEGYDEIPCIFSSVAHARQYLDQLAADVFRFRAELLQRASSVSSSSLEVSEDRDWVREYVTQNIASRRIVHSEDETILRGGLYRLQNNLTQWLSTFRSFTASSSSSLPETSVRRTLQLLEIQHFYSFFIAQTYSDRTETACDRFMPLFKHIIGLAECFMGCDTRSTNSSGDDGTSTITFTLESGISPALFLIALKCRDSNLRCRALHLLSENSCQEGLWEGALLAKFMKEVIDMEESYVIENESYSRNKILKTEEIPEGARLSDVAVMGCDTPGWGRVVGGVHVDSLGILLRERVFVI